MSDNAESLVTKYARPAPNVEDAADPYSTLNAARRQRQVMLDLRFRNGDSLGLNYSYLISVGFSRSGNLSLEFSAYRVAITGRNLEPLYRVLLAHQVANIQEIDPLADSSPETATSVYGIEPVKI
jgi:hypothetical protein